MLIEQAIFTSAVTPQGEGYHLVAASPGLAPADAQALAVWCPSHGALLDEGPAGQSFNFHGLPSGAYCISKTRAVGEEYSGRRGERLHTHCLVVAPAALERFANNPFALWQAATASGTVANSDEVPSQLEALPLLGRASAFQAPVVQRVLTAFGSQRFAALLDAVICNQAVGVCAERAPDEWLAAVVNCLPVECRTELTFSTGLRYSPQRAFRLARVPADKNQQMHLARQYGLKVLQLERSPYGDVLPQPSWARFVVQHFGTHGVAALAAHLVRPRPGLTCEELAPLAGQLEAGAAVPVAAAQPSAAAPQFRHAHAPHARTESAENELRRRIARPAELLAPENQAVIGQLEALDDAVYDTIAGEPGSLERLTRLWSETEAMLDGELLDQSREQYLRYAIDIWEGFLTRSDSAEKAVAALDVLCLLFDA